MSTQRTWRVRLGIGTKQAALEALCDDPRPSVRALVEALSEATTERGHRALGLDWARLKYEREVTYPIPPKASNISVANAAHGWARRHGLRIATRSTPRHVTVYVVSGQSGAIA